MTAHAHSALVLVVHTLLCISHITGAAALPSLEGPLVRTIAGSGSASSTDNTDPLKATFNEPRGLAVDAGGNLYIGEWTDSNRIRVLDAATKHVRTLAGTGYAGSDDGAGSSATFNGIQAMAVVNGGLDLLVVEYWNNQLRLVQTNGSLVRTALTGLTGPTDISLASDGTAWIAQCNARNAKQIRPVPADPMNRWEVIRTVTCADCVCPNGIAVAPDGNIYLADYVGSTVRVIDGTTFAISTFKATGAVRTVVLPWSGNVVVADTNAFNVNAIDVKTKEVKRLAGKGAAGHVDGRLPDAMFKSLRGIILDNNNDLIICDENDERVRKLELCTITYTTNPPVVYDNMTDIRIAFTASCAPSNGWVSATVPGASMIWESSMPSISVGVGLQRTLTVPGPLHAGSVVVEIAGPSSVFYKAVPPLEVLVGAGPTPTPTVTPTVTLPLPERTNTRTPTATLPHDDADVERTETLLQTPTAAMTPTVPLDQVDADRTPTPQAPGVTPTAPIVPTRTRTATQTAPPTRTIPTQFVSRTATPTVKHVERSVTLSATLAADAFNDTDGGNGNSNVTNTVPVPSEANATKTATATVTDEVTADVTQTMTRTERNVENTATVQVLPTRTPTRTQTVTPTITPVPPPTSTVTMTQSLPTRSPPLPAPRVVTPVSTFTEVDVIVLAVMIPVGTIILLSALAAIVYSPPVRATTVAEDAPQQYRKASMDSGAGSSPLKVMFNEPPMDNATRANSFVRRYLEEQQAASGANSPNHADSNGVSPALSRRSSLVFPYVNPVT